MSIIGKIPKPNPMRTLKFHLISYKNAIKNNDVAFDKMQDTYGNGLYQIVEAYKYATFFKSTEEELIFKAYKRTQQQLHPKMSAEQFGEAMTRWLRDSVTLPAVKEFFLRLLENLENINPEKPYIEEKKCQVIRCYNPDYGDDRVCKCGHTYYRHFDSYDNMENVGCKYCFCGNFEEAEENE